MNPTVWPMLLDLSRGECKRLLRHLELTAYEAVLSAFRAQGDLTKPKRQLLNDLQNIFSISVERHRAEVRRALNDEMLTTIADSISGPDVSSEWQIEGRHLAQLLPRLVPQTAFTITANQIANQQAEKNLSLPSPAQTGNKEAQSASSTATTPVSAKMARPTSPGGSNVVVLPSGMSIHIKGGLSSDEQDPPSRKRRRSSSADSVVVSRVTVPTTSTPVTVTRATPHSNAGSHGVSPMRITISKSPQKGQTTPTQKVILVSSASQSSSTRSIQSKTTVASSSVATTTTTSAVTLPKPSIIAPSSTPNTTSGNLGNIVTIATSTTSTTSASSSATTSTTSYLASTLTSVKPRARPITQMRPRQPQVQARTTTVMNPGPSSSGHVSTSLPTMQVKATTKPAIHIKQEGSMKIITHSAPAGGSKILPKPTPTSSVVVVTTVSGSLAVVSKGIGTIAGKVISIGPHGSKVITGSVTRASGANVVTVNPKTLHLTSGRIIASTTGGIPAGKVALSSTKPNVIVVQKSGARRVQSSPGTPTTQVIRTPSVVTSSNFEKELVSFIQRQEPGKPATIVKQGDKIIKRVETTHKPGPTITQSIKLPRRRSETDTNKSFLLAELIQAVGMNPDQQTSSPAPEAGNVQEEVVTMLPGSSSFPQQEVVVVSQPKVSEPESGNRWVEMDTATPGGSTDLPQDVADASAVQMLLNLQSSTQSKVKATPQRPTTINLSEVNPRSSPATEVIQVPQQAEVLTIDSSGGLIKEEVVQTTVAKRPPSNQQGQSSSAQEPSYIEVQLGSSDGNQLEVVGQEILQSLDAQSGVLYQVVNPGQGQPSTAKQVKVIEAKTPTILPSGAQIQIKSNPNPSSISVTPKASTTTVSSAVQVGSLISEHTVDQPIVDEFGKPLDIFSSALAQAQIDLDPYKFMEEEDGSKVVTVEEPSGTLQTNQPNLMSILNQTSTSLVSKPSSSQAAAAHVSGASRGATPSSDVSILSDVLMPQPPQVTVSKPSTFIPLSDTSKSAGTSTIHVVHYTQKSGDSQTKTPVVTSAVQGVTSSIAMATPGTSPNPEIMSSTEYTQEVVIGEGGVTEYLEVNDPGGHRSSKRKRKAPASADESMSPGSVGGWVRAALGLLGKVSKFRGHNKDKTAMSASAWFVRPVDIAEVPDYYDIIRNPMDFSTVKRKLENNQYNGWEDFHADMLLIRANAYEYNPPGHLVRLDCDEVFTFYQQEYEKTVDRWKKGHIGSPVAKKIHLDKSPSKLGQ